jgi:hypothetical protein
VDTTLARRPKGIGQIVLSRLQEIACAILIFRTQSSCVVERAAPLASEISNGPPHVPLLFHASGIDGCSQIGDPAACNRQEDVALATLRYPDVGQGHNLGRCCIAQAL